MPSIAGIRPLQASAFWSEAESRQGHGSLVRLSMPYEPAAIDAPIDPHEQQIDPISHPR